jgi:predicted nucleotidyltransferase
MRARALRWYVFGAQAVVAYGRPRMTGDVDVTVELAGGSRRELVDALGEHGFEPRFDLSDAAWASTHLLPMVHGPTRMPVDVVIARPGLHEEFLARARPVDIGGHTVPLISVEDLIVTKVLAGRRKDLEDVRGVLLGQWDAVDFEHIDRLLTSLEHALGEPKLRRRLARLVGGVRKVLGSG